MKVRCQSGTVDALLGRVLRLGSVQKHLDVLS